MVLAVVGLRKLRLMRQSRNMKIKLKIIPKPGCTKRQRSLIKKYYSFLKRSMTLAMEKELRFPQPPKKNI